jgi:2-polyprenyl-3-methyl-5-hydroxy-6-metoxy-1,4-benzoquinol methylase
VLKRRDVFRLYRRSPARTRLYLRVKLRICPLLRLETLYPAAGRIVDLGCGNGVFSNILKLGSPARDIAGYDLDPRKTEAAREVHGTIEGLRFETADIVELDYTEADVYTLVDVLYLIPFEAQEKILLKAFAALRPGGVLVLKDMDRRPRWKLFWNSCQETLAVKLIGFTLGSRFYFRGAEDYRRLMEEIGYAVEVVRLDKGQPYPHVAILGRKPCVQS